MNLEQLIKHLLDCKEISEKEFNKVAKDITVKVEGDSYRLLDISAIYFDTNNVAIGKEDTLIIEVKE